MDVFDRLAKLIVDSVKPEEREDAALLTEAGVALIRVVENIGADLDRIATALEKAK